MLTKQLREMERQATILQTFPMEDAIIPISENYWNKIKTEYRKWYKNHFGHKRKPIKNQLDFIQVCSYMKAFNWIIPCPNSGILRITLKDGSIQDIKFSIHK